MSQINQQELNLAHSPMKLQDGEPVVGRGPQDIVVCPIAGQTREQMPTLIAQECLYETRGMRTRLLRDMLLLKKRDILAPTRRGGVLAAVRLGLE